MLNTSMGPNDISRAFADDISTVIATLHTLPKIEKVFATVKRMSNLGIKVKKCVLMPLGEPFSDTLVRTVRGFLEIAVPNWSEFDIASAGEYLGFWIWAAAARETLAKG